MVNLAVVVDGIIQNVIVAESKELVEGLFPGKILVEETDQTGTPHIGKRSNGKKFEAVKVFHSWTWNEKTFEYDSPKPKPKGSFYWNEEEQDWLPVLEILDVESSPADDTPEVLEVLEVESSPVDDTPSEITE